MKRKEIKVLLVEDNEDDVVLTVESFADSEQVKIIDVVSNGEELLAYLRQQGNYEDVELPSLILMDINMPIMNGLEALKILKDDGALKHIPVVMLTTSNREEDINSAYRSGASSFISKPPGFLEFQQIAHNFAAYWVKTTLIPTMI